MSADDPQRRRVIVTGAAGAIGAVVRTRLAARWQLVASDVRDQPGIERLDITDAPSCHRLFAGADAVVHLAANADPNSSWEALRAPNVEGAYVVAAAARTCGVRRLVLASSLQAVSAYPEDHQRRSEDLPFSDNLYGATKAWAEALGGWVAATSDTSVVALRIGYFHSDPPADDERIPRNLSAWLSEADCAELIRAAVEADVTGFTIVNGVSANRFLIAERGANAERIGYHPADDAWARD